MGGQLLLPRPPALYHGLGPDRREAQLHRRDGVHPDLCPGRGHGQRQSRGCRRRPG
ncbi:hypothetical protein BDZ85DRAFT_254375 [Elsinoe ampelina]|uniref:Uncharacterized protein n=1 Tax=Elsinoe ampelina TaxID=302913 RepID=A0A6A6GNZ5_9PEZI|nr:hypothetical protein BDZ85DRAFT_254375 [Elsinoe ampelina]